MRQLRQAQAEPWHSVSAGEMPLCSHAMAPARSRISRAEPMSSELSYGIQACKSMQIYANDQMISIDIRCIQLKFCKMSSIAQLQTLGRRCNHKHQRSSTNASSSVPRPGLPHWVHPRILKNYCGTLWHPKLCWLQDHARPMDAA